MQPEPKNEDTPICPYGFTLQRSDSSPPGCDWFTCDCFDCRDDDRRTYKW